MKFRDILLSREIKFFVISIVILLFSYIILRFLIFDSDPLIPFFFSVIDSYLLLNEKFANLFLLWTGSHTTIQDHIILLNGTQLTGFTTDILYLQVVIIYLLLFWLIKTSTSEKIFLTVFLIVISFFFNAIYNAVGAHFIPDKTNSSSVLPIPLSLGYLSLNTILFIWYSRNKESILHSLSKLPVSKITLEKKLIDIVIIIYLFIVVRFLWFYSDFNLWIEVLFTSSQKILALLGYDAVVEPSLLIGDNGSIFMAKYCLGVKTMSLFASIVYLTGNDNKKRWIYILSGLLFLNLVNIMRFVLLFIHIQKNGDYALAMDLHDIYNYITYFIVFVLWVIWFEKFTDIRTINKKYINVQ